MKIQKVEKADLKNIAALAVQVWLDNYAIEGIRDVFSNYIWSELTPENFSRRLENKDREIYKVTEGEHLIGFAEINYNSSDDNIPSIKFEIEKLYIQENYCGKGIGAALLNFINSICASRKIPFMWLSVYEGNERAIKFYKKNNFIESGVLFFELETERHKNLVLTRKVV